MTEDKATGIFKYFWGKNVSITRAVVNGEDPEPTDLTAMESFVKHHVNLHSSMYYDGIYGIMGLDVPVPAYAVTNPTRVVGTMTLHHIMYNFCKLSTGHSLFAEVHQELSMGTVHVVIPNTPEAE